MSYYNTEVEYIGSSEPSVFDNQSYDTKIYENELQERKRID